ncbi:MAG: type II toxin-antitoxin system RatA family toxin [Cellvibrionaceae bacterium]
MAKVERSALVAYSAQQMFDLINDIESYPLFMTGCVAAEVISANEKTVEARLTLGKSGIEQSFITRNELIPPSQMIMRLVEGPFSHFEGRWQFDSLQESACKVSLNLEFAFSNPILALSVGKWMQETASQQVDALCQRADVVYGAK